jgi:hypothetical protein
VDDAFELVLPAHLDEDAAVIESKGYLSGVEIRSGDNTYMATFYDETRVVQTIADDLPADGHFFERNLVVVRRVTRAEIEQAVEHLSRSGFDQLAPE